ncbi:hypothetical protein C0Q70_11507 [Pomacea canaliculata]|uniref:Proteasome assembly chaperone 1 n=1 Tax=Pomacea canaliculata TaxID=400727 RepID=A0A2T7P650_POMCA|nr:hypothetical protein C0Q70_11507 [Pomacea canaliculata]
MATFFGEVLQVISRAVDDDDEEDETICLKSDPYIYWSKSFRTELGQHPDYRATCDILVIAFGAAAAGFVNTCIKHSKYDLIGGIFSGLQNQDSQTLMQQSLNDKKCYIYRSSESLSTFICLCNADVAVEQSSSWVNQLFSGLRTQNAFVLVLNTSHASRFISDVPTSDLSLPILRGLKTSHFPDKLICPVLEQPNLMTGVPAQVMTHCQVHGIKGVLYQCYTSARNLVDTATIKAFWPVLSSTSIKDFVQILPDFQRGGSEKF